jgi:hypothetical protein
VASSPCQAYSYMAMPWTRAKQIAAALRGAWRVPRRLQGARTIAELNELFEQPARIQREACEAAGRFIPMIQENVKGAQPWVGPARGITARSTSGATCRRSCRSRHGREGAGDGLVGIGPKPGYKAVAVQRSTARCNEEHGGSWFNVAHNTTSGKAQNPDGRKVATETGSWFNSKSLARKRASAEIAKIPFALSSHIARVYYPTEFERVSA